MGVYEGRGQLTKSLKELMARWATTKGVWQDQMAENFEKTHLIPLEMDVRNTVGAMDHMAVLLGQVKRDCGE